MPTLTFKVSPEEARRIRAFARGERLTVSAYLRRQACGTEAASEPIRRIRCPHTGAMVFGPAVGHPALTTRSVGEMLADFP